MSKVQMLRGLVEQRLTAAAEEIFGLFERTIAEYEEELCRSKEEHERQRKRLDAVFSPQLRLHRAVLPQQHVCKEEEVLSDQQLCIQERNSSLDQKDQDPPQIKEEQEQLCTNQWGKRLVLKQETDTFRHSNNVNNTNMSEIHHLQQLSVVKAEDPPEQQEWSSSLGQKDPDPPHIKEEQEGQQIQGLEDADIKFPFTSVPVMKEDDDEKAQSSQLHGSQTEENRETERTGADGEECEEPESARNSDPDNPLQPATLDKTSHSPESETDDSADWEETSEPQTGLNPLPNNEEPVSDVRCNTGKSSVSSSERAGSFGRKKRRQKPSGVQTGEKPFSCSVCGKRYLWKKTLTTHMKLHSEEKCSTCSVCKATFCQPGNLARHMRIHTGDKPFSCSICSKRFTQRQHLKPHLAVHKGEKPFNCSVCSKRFTQKQHLKQHLTSHTGEKPFSCSVCSKSYALKQHLKRHLTSHTGEKLFSCSVCDKRFAHKQHLNTHLAIHAGEKPFSCSVCSKRFTLKQSLKKHFRIHNGEK